MAQSFFIWNGEDCRSKGIIMRGPAPIIRAEERVRHIEIPGKAGDLTETEGENIFNSYIQTITISVRGGFNVRNIYKWLRGSGYVTFSGEPNRRQKARVIGAITLNRVSRNLDNWRGEVQFYCQPFKEKLLPDVVTITSSGKTVINTGDVNAKPMYKVTATGESVNIMLESSGTPANNAITVTGLSNGTVIWIDSDAMEVWNENKDALLTANSTGNFPVLAQGANTLTGSGWSSVEIEKRERFL